MKEWIGHEGVALKRIYCSQKLSIFVKTHEPRHEKTCLREFPTRSDSNWPAQLQRLARVLKFWLQKLETLHHLGSEQRC